MILGGDRNQLGAYIREIANLMGLRDWRLVLADEPPQTADADDMLRREDDTAGAYVEVIYGRKLATVSIASTWPQWDPEELRVVVVHELVHCHVEPMRWAFNNVRSITPQTMYQVMYEAFRDAMEPSVDGIATAWAETLPLPIRDEQEDGE